MNNTDSGERISAARGYLTKDVRARTNLTIMGSTRVEKLLLRVRASLALSRTQWRTDGHTRPRGDPFMGAIHSPAFLIRNGIGPARDLKALGSM